MVEGIAHRVVSILSAYDPARPAGTADRLRELWLEFEPNQSMGAIKAEQRAMQETVGVPVPMLKAIGDEIGKAARKRVAEYLPLTRLLWDAYGREGRVVALFPLGKMALAQPGTIIPLLMILCRTCVTWEDADRLAMDSLEPVVRKQPDRWLAALEPWLADENKWVRRAGVTVVGRLPMKHPDHTAQCLQLTERLLLDEDVDVRRAVSFAIRVAARGDIALVRDFLASHVPPADAAATWALCDAVRSMTKKYLPELLPVLPNYRTWAADPTLSARDRRSVESAVTTLEQAL